VKIVKKLTIKLAIIKYSMYLFIIEGAGKIKKISKILGKDYLVLASGGHALDLHQKLLSVDIDDNYHPTYYLTSAGKKSLPDIKRAVQKASKVYIASDEDREGEAIGKNIVDYLGIKKYQRLHFNSLDKKVLEKAIKDGGDFYYDLVDAQKARRILDRLVGWLVSPVITRLMGKTVSAGRVQSVTLRLIVDREIEIEKFINNNSDSTYYTVTGMFEGLRCSLLKGTGEGKPLKGSKATVKLDDTPHDPIKSFMKKCKLSKFKIHDISEKMSTRKPSPPFMTVTMQQEANRKLGMSSEKIQSVAQKLYEAGYITYIRTDSVEISEDGMKAIKKTIIDKYGKSEYQENHYKSKVKNAQEAHECIRPVDPDLIDLSKEIDDRDQIRLYELIWRRAIASQMKSAKIKVYTIQISISELKKYYFQTQMEKVIDPGFLAVYQESKDEEEEVNPYTKFPPEGKEIKMDSIEAKQEFTRHPPRFTEPSLQGKMVEIGIGRPGTTTNFISLLYRKGYMIKGDIKGIEKEIRNFKITSKSDKIESNKTTLMYGADKGKLIPTKLGRELIEILMKHFALIMDYDFTIKLEDELDDVSNGKKDWHKVVDEFYKKLKPLIDSSKALVGEKTPGIILGEDDDGHVISIVSTRFGDAVKIMYDTVPVFVDLPEGETPKTMTLKKAIKALSNVHYLGEYKGKPVLVKKGEKGWYIINGTTRTSTEDENIKLEGAIKLLEKNNFGDYVIKTETKKIKARALNGPYGPYLQIVTKTGKKKNYTIPPNMDPRKLTNDQILQLMEYKKNYDEQKAGRTSGGRTSQGRTSGGKTSGGKTSGGKTSGGKTSGGKTSGGKTSGGKSTFGKSTFGKSTFGKSTFGKSTFGKTSRGKTYSKKNGENRSKK